MPGRVLDEVENVRPLHWVAAGKDEHWHADGGHLVNKSVGLKGRKLQGVRARLRPGPAVYASQVASLRRLPDHDEGLLVKVHSRPHVGVQSVSQQTCAPTASIQMPRYQTGRFPAVTAVTRNCNGPHTRMLRIQRLGSRRG